MRPSPKNTQNYILSVVVPAFNEELVIEECINRLTNVLIKMKCGYEIVFVNDGSRDKTLELLKKARSKDPHIKIVNLSRNFGHQIAITAGMDRAIGNAIIVIDADLQDPPEIFPELVAKWQEGYDIVHARRRKRAGDTKLKVWTASLFYRVLKRLTNIDIPVDVGDFRLVSRRALQSFQQLKERRRYVRGMMAWLGYPQAFVDFDREKRFAGTTKYPVSKLLRLAFDGISSFSIVPLRFATFLGFFSIVFSLIFALTACYLQIFLHRGSLLLDTILFAIFFLGGIQLLCVGIVGEYLGILHEEAKNRPLYFVNDSPDLPTEPRIVPLSYGPSVEVPPAQKQASPVEVDSPCEVEPPVEVHSSVERRPPVEMHPSEE
jgi:polyisoprenyl-phosphate glycosyltransferase